MPAKPRSTRDKTNKTASKNKVGQKPVKAQKTTAPSHPAPVETLRQTIAYFFVLSYIPPDSLGEFIYRTTPKRQELATSAGMEAVEYFRAVTPEICRRMVAFHQASRNPDAGLVESLVKKALVLDENPAALAAYQEEVERLAVLPGRAKAENRLHRNKGCRYCLSPCRFGYFTLVSDPHLNDLGILLDEEAALPADKQTPIRPLYAFTMTHLSRVTGSGRGSIAPLHLSNLAYCLLLLSMARSRQPMPERQLGLFQGTSLAFLRKISHNEGG